MGMRDRYNITVTVEDPQTKAAVSVTYRSVIREDAMRQPALASAILMLENAELDNEDGEKTA